MQPAGEMSAASGRPARAIAWRIIGQYLPIAAFTLAAFLAIRAYNDRGASEPKTAVVAADHAANLAENIRFFESHVAETKDSLSYNRLTGLYLQRVRESGDVSDIKRAELALFFAKSRGPNRLETEDSAKAPWPSRRRA